MAILELALLLLATVLASAVIDQLLPRLPLPLIQILCGVVVALLAHDRISITLNPELFLVMFVAPLLFQEARASDKAALWHNRHSLLSFAIGLVVAIVLAVGFTMNAFVPSIPLAAAFALGAALGPTDPLAVASVQKRAAIPHRQETVLQGESLLNDASGIVSFQFAVAAVTTGTFSALGALGKFAYSFFGALLVGIVLGYAFVKTTDKVRDMGLENTTFHVALELLAPFIAYLLGETLGMSGIILVVACGITMSVIPQTMRPSISRTNIVSSSVWKVITFALNGVVFVLLGTQLPQAYGDVWVDAGIRNSDLILYILVLTAIVHGMRFIWSLISEARVYHGLGEKLSVGQRVRSAAIMTLSGSKGAITLAIMLSLPITLSDGSGAEFPQRDLLIFLACGVILLSLLMATFIVPLLTPRKRNEDEQRARDNEGTAQILRTVIEELTAHQTPQNKKALGAVIQQYTTRLERFKEERDLEDESDMDLRLQVLGWEQEYVLNLIDADEVPAVEGYQYVSRVARISAMMRREKRGRIALLMHYRRVRTFVRKVWVRFLRQLPGDSKPDAPSTSHVMRDIQARSAAHVVSRLKESMAESDIQSEKISQLIAEYEHTLSLLVAPAPSITALARQTEPDLDALRLALRIELQTIQDAYEQGLISRTRAQKMRKNVYLMQLDVEDYV